MRDIGTGKTMTAEVLAGGSGLDRYRIDQSALVSNYIPDTESRAALLLDEADALFGKRSKGKDSDDRYANIEVSYMLQLDLAKFLSSGPALNRKSPCNAKHCRGSSYEVGATGFEPATSCSRSRRATGLRYAPIDSKGEPVSPPDS